MIGAQAHLLPSLNSENRGGGHRKSEMPIVCAGQRVIQEGSSPSGARMRGAISKSGGNASLAGKEDRYGEV
jgi:hypothetical protein